MILFFTKSLNFPEICIEEYSKATIMENKGNMIILLFDSKIKNSSTEPSSRIQTFFDKQKEQILQSSIVFKPEFFPES